MSNVTGARHVRWEDVPLEDLGGGTARRFIHGDKLMMAQIEMPAGVVVPKHHHEHEQLTNLVSGKVEFRFGEDLADVRVVSAGEAVVIPSNLPHQVTGLEDARIIELFAPPREDWIDGTDAYLRGGNG